MQLADYGEPLAYETAFWYVGLTNPEYPLDELGQLSQDLAQRFRSLAIITLLVHGDSDHFFHNLIRSGLARETYLRRLREQGVDDDHQQASGRVAPLLDTLAAGDWDRARRIVALSPLDYRAGHEYEDDYCYAQILHRFLQSPPRDDEVTPLLERLAAYADDAPGARLLIGQALLDRDQAAFDEAFDALLDERERQITADKARGQLEDAIVVPQRHVFIEGLALLRLAAERGLQIQAEYRFCPSLARVPLNTPFPGE